jgi:phosphopantothenoylcysteine decarboxylase/phosphopantothenate--cysteine ligase
MSVEPPDRVKLVRAATAAEMERAMLAESPAADVVLMAAAVSDYRPARAAREKIARSGEPLTLALEPNADILAQIGRARRPGQVLVGFALETTHDVKRARAKLGAKGVDLVVLNSAGEAIGGETNRVTLVEAHDERDLPLQSKREVAEQILDRVSELRSAGRTTSEARA